MYFVTQMMTNFTVYNNEAFNYVVSHEHGDKNNGVHSRPCIIHTNYSINGMSVISFICYYKNKNKNKNKNNSISENMTMIIKE